MNKLKELISIMNFLAEEFCPQNYNISELKIQTWDDMLLKKYGIQKIKIAAEEIIKTKIYSGFPKISEIIRLIEGDIESIEDIALCQWFCVRDTIEKCGAYASIKYDDLLIHKTIKAMGGWINLCKTSLKNLPWKEKEFIKIYAIFKKQDITDAPEYLPGIHSNYNNSRNLDYQAQAVNIKTKYPTQTKTPKFKLISLPNK